MILPIYTYGKSVLSKKGEALEKDHPNLNALIDDMFQTMKQAGGIGLAAQQIGLPLKLFVIDLVDYTSADESLKDFKKIFINSEVIELSEDVIEHEEGCLSYPGIHIPIKRSARVKLKYLNENFEEKEEWFEGLPARCVLHEHDHTEGITFIKHLDPLRRRLLESKLKNVAKQNFSTNYKVKR